MWVYLNLGSKSLKVVEVLITQGGMRGDMSDGVENWTIRCSRFMCLLKVGNNEMGQCVQC